MPLGVLPAHSRTPDSIQILKDVEFAVKSWGALFEEKVRTPGYLLCWWCIFF